MKRKQKRLSEKQTEGTFDEEKFLQDYGNYFKNLKTLSLQ